MHDFVQLLRKNHMAKKKIAKTIPKLRTPQSISEATKRPLHEVLNAIFLNNIIPTAFADDIPVFNSEQQERIESLLPGRTRKVN